jgi:hypothetical protein
MRRTSVAVASPLLKPVAIRVVGMPRPVIAPIIAMTTGPDLLSLSLIGAVVVVASQLVLVPAPSTLTLTGRHAAITLLGNLRTRPE